MSELDGVVQGMYDEGIKPALIQEFVRRYNSKPKTVAAVEPKKEESLVDSMYTSTELHGSFKYDSLIDSDLIKTRIENNPKYNGAIVDIYEGGTNQPKIRTPDGTVYSTYKEGLKRFEEYYKNRTKLQERKDIALGNIGSDRNHEKGQINSSRRLKAAGYEMQYEVYSSSMFEGGITGEVDSQWTNDATKMTGNVIRLMKDGVPVPISFQEQKTKDTWTTQNYSIEDMALKYIYDNISNEDLTKVEAINIEDQELYRQKVEEIQKNTASSINDNDVTRDYLKSPAYRDRFLDDIKESGISEEGVEIVKGHIAKYGQDLSSLKQVLNSGDLRSLNATIKKRELNLTYEKGKKVHKKKMINSRIPSFMTAYTEGLSDEEHGGMKAGAEQQQYNQVIEQKRIKKKFEYLQRAGERKLKEKEILIKDISAEAISKGVGLDVVDGLYIATGEDITAKEEINARLKIFNSSMKRDQKIFNEDKDEIVGKHGEWLLENDLLYSQSDLINRQYGNWNMFRAKFGGRSKSLLLSIPALLGDTQSVKWKQQIEESLSESVKLVPTYDEAVASGQVFSYLVGNTADQAPNIIAALVATYFGGTTAGATIFGIDSAASSWVETDSAVKTANKAKLQLEDLEKYKDQIDYDDYKENKIALQNQIMAGDLTQGQRYGAAFVSGGIEFGVAYGLGKLNLGTAGWANKMVGRTATAGTRELGEAAFTSGWGASKNLLYTTLRDQAGELVEEITIEGLTTISNSMILGREMDFSTLDDVAVSTIATGGMMGTGNVYTAVVSHYKTAPLRLKANEAFTELEKIKDRMATLPKGKENDVYRAQLKEQYLQQLDIFGDITAEMEVASMIGGSSNLKALAKNSLNLRGLNEEAGVEVGDTETDVNKRREDHIKTLNRAEAEDFQNRLDQATEEQIRLQDVDFDSIDIEDMFGVTGLAMEEKLKKNKKTWPKNRKDQIIKIHQALQKQAVDRNITYAKRQDKDGKIQKFINQTIYGDPNYNGKRDKKAENLVWQDLAKNLLIRQARATSLYKDGGKLSQTLLNTKELSDIDVILAKDKKELELAISRDENLSPEEKAKNIDLLRKGKVRGLISNGKYITLDKKSVDIALKNGDITQGTVVSHEISHAIDALAMTKSELTDFAEKLESDISDRYSKVDVAAKRRLSTEIGDNGKPLYDLSKNFKDQSDVAKDEYTKAVQEAFQGGDFANESMQLKQERQSSANKLRGIVPARFGGDYKFKSGQDATFYVANFIDSFNKGEMSKTAKRRIKARPGLLSRITQKKAIEKVEKKEKQRYSDDTIGVKTEEFTVTQNDGTTVRYKAKTYLDGTVKFDMFKDNAWVPSSIVKLNVKPGKKITSKEAVEQIYGKNETVKLDKTEGWESLTSEKKWSRLTQEQKERVDPKRAKEVKGETKFSKSNMQGILTDFKAENKIEGDIKKDDKSAKRKLVGELLKGGETNLQNSKLGQEAGGIIESIAKRLYDNIPKSELAGVTRSEYKDRLLMDLATMIEKEYSEVTVNKSGKTVRNTLDNFSSSRLNTRAGIVAKDMGVESSVDFGGLGFKTTLDDAKNIPSGDVLTKSEVQEKQINSIRRKIGIQKGSDFYNDIVDSVIVSLVSAGDVNSDTFKKDLQDAFANKLVNKLKNIMGTPKSAKYLKFLNDSKSGVYGKIGLETLNQRFQHFTEAIVDDAGKQKRKGVEKSDMDLKVKSKTAGNAEFTKKPATKQVLEDWVNYFINPQSVTPGVGRADSRRNSLAEALSIELGFDATMEVLEDPATFAKLKALVEFRGFEVADNYLALLGKKIDRAPGTKFSGKAGNTLFDFVNDQQSILNLRDHLSKDKEALNGANISPILNSYIKTLPKGEQLFLQPYVDQIIKNHKKVGKEITEKELREGLTEQQKILGSKIGFKFYDGVAQAIKEISNGTVTMIDLSIDGDDTGSNGFNDYKDGLTSFTKTLDPSVHGLSLLSQALNGGSAQKFGKSKQKMLTPETRSLYGKDNKIKDYKGDIKQAKKIANVEEKVLTLVKKLPANPTPQQIMQFKKDVDKIIPPIRRKAVQDFRDYFYNKLDAWINEAGIKPKEKLKRIAWAAKMLQINTNASSGIARQGAVITSVTLDYSTTQVRAKTGKIRPFQQEHNIQLLNFNMNILKGMFNNTFKRDYPIIADKYVQTLLDADAQALLDSTEGKMSKEVLAKYNVNKGKLAESIGKTSGFKGFRIGMDSESMFMIALGNASRTVDLRTGLTFDKVIFNKINLNKTLDYLDGIAANINKNMGNTQYSRKVLDNKNTIFTDATNTDLFNRILTKSVLGINPKSDIFMLAQRIDNKETYDKVKKANDTVLLNYGLSTKQELKVLTEAEKINKLKTVDKATKFSRKGDVEARGMSTFDFDETAGISDNFVIAKKDGETRKITSTEWSSVGDQMLRQGWKMDFSDFNKVTNGRPGPLMQKLKNQIKKYGNKNVFILTARAAESAPAIKAYLESEGIDLDLKNITGLGDSTGEAKAMWMLEKFAEGYNDMYFVDDAIGNVKAVKNVLNQLDIKSKVVQTKFSGKADLNIDFNQILEDTKGINAESRYSDALAKTKGASIGKYKFFLPPSAEDFEGLMYPILGRGKKGDAQKAWFNKHLFQPFARANRDINAAKQKVANEYRALKKQNPSARKKLKKQIPGSSFTYDHAARVYLWNKAGFEIPGLSKRDQVMLAKVIEENIDVKAFADQLGQISQQKDGYTKPSSNWVVETVASDLNNISQKVGRKEFLAEWIQNKKIIFSNENLNKLESVFGSNYREALEDMLYRMENGTNRSFGNNRLVNQYSNWVNNSVGAIMFFNMRSAVLQTLSTVNFINWSDNNPLKAAAAFANQPQYWSDFSMIFNSDMLKQRRSGLKTDVNQAELAAALVGQTNKAKAALNYLLKIGFTPTQIADSFAISAGGATFYRNRVKTYLKQGMDNKAAENQAFEDFQEISEKTQQSSRADLVSQQQASPLGRLILAFQNTPMQYTRLMKKAAIDLAKGRGDWKTNVSKLIYYGTVQNFIFSSLQSALFATVFGSDEDDEDALDDKKVRIANTMVDSILRGSGLTGAVISTIKNIIMTFMKQEEKGFMADHTYTVLQAINLSPPIGSKARKLYSGIQTWRFNKDAIKHKGLSLDNPIWQGVGNVIDAGTNVPVGRLIQKLNNVSEALDSQNKTWQRIALILGWNTWDLGVEDEELNALKLELKNKKKKKKKTGTPYQQIMESRKAKAKSKSKVSKYQQILNARIDKANKN
tara:strand:+ start:1736 stop:11485 length:9750 start_codon:yes stop_codon:yes gene_type:complete